MFEKIKSSDVRKSRLDALGKIKQLLDVPDIEGQFTDKNGSYHSSEKFIVSWLGNANGFGCEFQLEKCDDMYRTMSGYVCVHGYASLIQQKQISGYQSFELGLIQVGLKLCSGNKQKMDFFNRYAVPYNERVKMMEGVGK
ncbi:conserved hypothetical protein [Vibrio chagasii]|nr:conserved hypothetical protein [Vibrio chagasii]